VTGARAAAAVILAAGAGTRLGGRPKALLRRDGEYLVERAERVAREGGCAAVVVVLGCHADRVAATADLTGARLATNREWATGIGSSLRAGLRALTGHADADARSRSALPCGETPTPPGAATTAAPGPRESDARDRINAALVLLVDQPFVGAGAVRAVLGAHAGAASLAVATYGGRRGHPVLLGRDHWAPAAATATGDRGARAYLAARRDELTLVRCDGLGDPVDIDMPEDLDRYGIEVG
jgi:nicotine blue oxidoreductase